MYELSPSTFFLPWTWHWHFFLWLTCGLKILKKYNLRKWPQPKSLFFNCFCFSGSRNPTTMSDQSVFYIKNIFIVLFSISKPLWTASLHEIWYQCLTLCPPLNIGRYLVVYVFLFWIMSACWKIADLRFLLVRFFFVKNCSYFSYLYLPYSKCVMNVDFKTIFCSYIIHQKWCFYLPLKQNLS